LPENHAKNKGRKKKMGSIRKNGRNFGNLALKKVPGRG